MRFQASSSNLWGFPLTNERGRQSQGVVLILLLGIGLFLAVPWIRKSGGLLPFWDRLSDVAQIVLILFSGIVLAGGLVVLVLSLFTRAAADSPAADRWNTFKAKKVFLPEDPERTKQKEIREEPWRALRGHRIVAPRYVYRENSTLPSRGDPEKDPVHYLDGGLLLDLSGNRTVYLSVDPADETLVLTLSEPEPGTLPGSPTETAAAALWAPRLNRTIETVDLDWTETAAGPRPAALKLRFDSGAELRLETMQLWVGRDKKSDRFLPCLAVRFEATPFA